MANIGIVTISEDLLLDLLHFQGGHIRSVGFYPEHGLLRLQVEHPDMPEVGEGEAIPEVLPEVLPEYVKNYGENGQVLSITRKVT